MAGVDDVYRSEKERINADLEYEANKEARADHKEFGMEQQLLDMKNNTPLSGQIAAFGLERLGIDNLFGG